MIEILMIKILKEFSILTKSFSLKSCALKMELSVWEMLRKLIVYSLSQIIHSN